MCLNNTTDAPQKTCSKCGESKPATTEYFHRAKLGLYGLAAVCKPCVAQYAADNKEREAERKRAWHIANKERMNERSRAYHAANRERENQRRQANYKANIEREREYRRKWAIANSERVAKNLRAWREANRDSVLEKQRVYGRKRYTANKRRENERVRAWAIANPLANRMRKHRRRALERNAEGTHTAEDVQRQYKAQRGKCYYCGTKVGDTYHVDHVIPLSRGGTNWPENLVIACPQCNQSKNDKLPHEWSQGGRLL